ncbi:hypothetical protein NBRC116188_00620 [Oceaniserpentilla sp. 4NH20-0058]|uniref:hypothetical protein n=1 Tax=Oceaniserpentilla sp. 4NH20-0058 TaxID=3127660 RepID=UPI003108CDFF
MIKTALKKLCSVLGLSLLLSANPVTANASPNDSLKDIYDMRVLTFAILSDYYMFSGLEGDSRYNREIESNIKQFEHKLSQITDATSPTAKLSSLANAITEWQKYKDLLDINRADFLTQGYANARLVSDLSDNAISLSDSLNIVYKVLIDENKIQLNDFTKYTREMGLIIQTVTAEYAARSTSSLGQVNVININEGGMDNQGKVFSDLLAKLKDGASERRIYKLVDQVGVKWEFIAKSIANYNKNAVPFIVSSYGDRISKDLAIIEERYVKSLQAKK